MAEVLLRDAHGFTQHGVERLNDSISSYIYCIFGILKQELVQ